MLIKAAINVEENGIKLDCYMVSNEFDKGTFDDIVKLPENSCIILSADTHLTSDQSDYLNYILTDYKFIRLTFFYDLFVRNHFKNNILLVNKWLKYGKTVREIKQNG